MNVKVYMCWVKKVRTVKTFVCLFFIWTLNMTHRKNKLDHSLDFLNQGSSISLTFRPSALLSGL